MASAFQRAFGKSPKAAFTSFDEKPIAAASLGQVHEARNAAGDRLAVKILYPNVAEIIRVDLRVLGWALSIYRTFVPIAQIERVKRIDAIARAMASNSSFGGPEKAEAPVSCSQPGPRVSACRRAASCRSPFARRASSNHPGDVRRRTRTR